MSKYEAIFNCGWCGEVPLSDEEVEDKIFNDAIGSCLKCHRLSYCNSIRAKCIVDVKGWRLGYGSTEDGV